MNTQVMLAAQELALFRDHLVGIFPLAIGVIVVVLLIGAVVLGIRVRRREPDPPSPESQPKLPEDGPVGEVMENREPDAMPEDGERRLPPMDVHNTLDKESHPGEPVKHGKWTPGKSGSFGSGGLG